MMDQLLIRMSAFIQRVKKYFGEAEFAGDLAKIEDLIVEALPFLDAASCIAAGIMPKNILTVELAVVNTAFPRLFDGTIHTHDELSSYILGVAANLLQQRNPGINTTIARAAVQLAFLLKKHDKEQKL